MIKFLPKKLVKSLIFAGLAGLTATADAQTTFTWSPAGPIYTAGRARNMIVDKSDASGNTMYVGSTTSGLFKTTDGGVNWAPLNDQGTVRNISYLAQSSDGTIYVATGEGFLRPSQKAKALPGTGLYKLVGSVITPVTGADATATGTVINRIACHPTDPNKIALATNLGVLVSTNGGNSWTNAVPSPTTDLTVGQDVEFNSNGILYFSFGNETASPSLGSGTGLINSMVYKSDGSLTTFSNITPTHAAVPAVNYGRIELAVAPSNPNVVYASCARKQLPPPNKNSSTLQGLFVTYDGGSTWGNILVGSSQLDPLSNGGTLASGDYAHTILVSPSSSDVLLMGSYYFYVFERTGGPNSSPSGNWVQVGSPFALNSQYYLHENIHDIKVVGGTKFYFVTDAGIYRSIDITTAGNQAPPSFQPFYKGLVTGQFNSVSIDRFPGATGSPTSAAGTSLTPYQTYIGGTGGNGMTFFSGNYPLVTQELSYETGDIFNTEYSKILPKAAYFSSSSGAVYRTADVTTGVSNLSDFVQNTKNQTVQSLLNSTYTLSGTPFKMWENYGSLTPPDSMIFYNDTAIARSTITTLTATTQFSFSVGRPQPSALIDSITIRTSTVVIPATPAQVTILGYSQVNTNTLSIKLANNYTANPTGTTSAQIYSVTGNPNGTPLISNQVILNATTNLDQIFVTLGSPLFSVNPTSSPGTSNPADYLRVTATVYYKYKPGSTVKVVDANISTMTNTYTIITPTIVGASSPTVPMSWNTSTNQTIGNPVLKVATRYSARLAIPYTSNAASGAQHSIRVSNAPLDLNTPLSFVTVSSTGGSVYTTDASGNPTQNTITVTGKPYLIEWGKSGTNLYYATDAGANHNVYRVSQIFTLADSTAKFYGGKQHSYLFSYGQPTNSITYTMNPRCPYRTTLIGTFPKKITSMSISSTDSEMALTFDDPTGTLVMLNGADIRTSNSTNINWSNKTGTGIPAGGLKTYCSLLEKGDYKKMFMGTDNGLYYTNDVTAASPTWSNVNNNQLPNVQIFDLKQQTMEPYNCYNSGQIFIATNGRGIWTNNQFFTPYVVSVDEKEQSKAESRLKLIPNPTNGNVFVSFEGIQGETATVHVIDINGRVVKSENMGKLVSGKSGIMMETTDLTSGVYIVNVTSDSGIKRVSKLIVTK